jgi:hypothetical protein
VIQVLGGTMDWNSYFAKLSDWKKLPAYKAEPRVDSLIAYYLPQIISDYFHVTVIGMIPELPIRLGTIKPQYKDTNFADRSYKVDFYLMDSSKNNYFVEFKTDSGSRMDKQDLYLNESKCVGMKDLVEGICHIASVSSYKDKYTYLLKKLTELGLIDDNKQFSGDSNYIEIVYVQPHTTVGDKCINFKWIADWMKQKYGNNEFELELANTLGKWSE